LQLCVKSLIYACRPRVQEINSIGKLNKKNSATDR
jgi:hypothetical protein